jgi:hypothetical protein
VRRTFEEATKLIDEIVGRCIRHPEYGERVLSDPEATLAEYQPDEDILDDFRALSEHREEALDGWRRLRSIVYEK